VPTDEETRAATARLSAEDRALVELFDRRGLSAEQIAGMIGIDVAEVERRHAAATERLEAELAAGRDEEPATEEAAAEPRDAARAEKPSARRGAIVAAVIALVVLVGVVIAVASGGGGSGGSGAGDGGSGAAQGSTEEAAGEPAGEGPVVTMKRLNGTYGRGTAQLAKDGDRTVLRLRARSFLQPVGGGYAVWLVKSDGDTRRLYATTDTTIRRDFPLPDDFESYRSVEVARAIPELSSDYSDLVLLRASVAELAGP
jgi:hypothetical protein